MRGEILMDLTHNFLKMIKYKIKKTYCHMIIINLGTTFFMGAACVQ